MFRFSVPDLRLSVVLPESVAPFDSGLGSDRRRLGLGLQSIRVTW